MTTTDDIKQWAEARQSQTSLTIPIVRHQLLDVSSSDHTFAEGDEPRVIKVGVAGNITLTDQYNNDVTYAALAGEPFIGLWAAVKTSGTDAGNIVAQW